MPDNVNAINKVLQAYYILDLGRVTFALAQRVQAEPQDHQALLDAGFKWEENKLIYSEPRMGGIAALPNGMFIWMYNTFGKVLKNSNKLNIWIDGRCETFLGELTAAANGTSDGVTFTGTGERSVPYTPKPLGDPTDQLIAKLKRQAGTKNTLPSDTMIDLGLKAQKDGDQKLLAYLKTVKPMNENRIKRSQLNALIREIIKGIVKEGYDTDDDLDNLAQQVFGNEWVFSREKKGEAGHVLLYRSKNTPDSRLLWKTPSGQVKFLEPKTKKWMDAPIQEMTGTGAVSPIATPKAFQKRKIHEGDEADAVDDMWAGSDDDLEAHGMGDDSKDKKSKKKVEEMTTTGNVSGYNIPGAFAKKGGSSKGVEGSAALGYKLTPQGEKEMSRKADRLYND